MKKIFLSESFQSNVGYALFMFWAIAAAYEFKFLTFVFVFAFLAYNQFLALSYFAVVSAMNRAKSECTYWEKRCEMWRKSSLEWEMSYERAKTSSRFASNKVAHSKKVSLLLEHAKAKQSHEREAFKRKAVELWLKENGL